MSPRIGVVSVCLVTLLAGGCSNPGERQEILPMNLGEWRRTAVEQIPAEEHKEELKRMGIKAARRGMYEKNGQRVTAAVYQFGASAVAFELVQKFRPEPGKIAFHQGNYFVVLESQTSDATVLNSFASILEGTLKE